MADFRDSTDTLGAVIKKTMATRDAHWAPVAFQKNDTPAHVPERAAPQPKPEKNKREGKGSGSQPRAAPQRQELKLSLLNGDGLCPAFQKGVCRTQGNRCPAGSHKCAVVTNKSGRVCGMSNHGANNHPTGKRN